MGRIEADPDLPPHEIPGLILNEVFAHSLESLPEECCGLVTGAAPLPFRQVHRCRNDMTRHHRNHPVSFPRDGRGAFFMNELDYLRVQKEAETRGDQVTAIYHSHVDAEAYFSELDREYAEKEWFPFPDAAHIVVAVLNRRVVGSACFERVAGEFQGRVIRAVAP